MTESAPGAGPDPEQPSDSEPTSAADAAVSPPALDENSAAGTHRRRRLAGDGTTLRLPRRRKPEPLMPDLGVREIHKGTRPGTKFVRIERSSEAPLRRKGDTTYQSTIMAERAKTPLGRLWDRIRKVAIGAKLTTESLIEERLTKIKALAIFSSDALSSSAYATEEILLVLVLAGSSALNYSIPISIAIATMLVVVAASYRQTVHAYPNGGGAYIVGRENLGQNAGTVAAAALLVDYILTVSVSTAAGVAAITSAFPELASASVPLAIFFVALVTVINLRGIRESGTIFAVPTYLFILAFGGMLVVGLIRLLLDLGPAERVDVEPEATTGALTIFLILRAFSSGSAALTGIEAISNGVPSFKQPESKNAAVTLAWMALLCTLLFVGLTVIAHGFDIVPSEDKTVVSQVAHAAFGSTVFFYLVQATTAMILILAANTAFAGFPRLASILSTDGYMPRQFQFRGDRLGFTNGILALGLLAAILLFAYGADVHSLIPLYAVGVFVSFTISQTGMVVHWLRLKEGNWKQGIAINGFGAALTAVVAVVIISTKFLDGAWLTIIAIGAIVVGLRLVSAHYKGFERDLAAPPDMQPPSHKLLSSQRVIVPVNKINRAVYWTLEYALSISNNVSAVHVEHEDELTGDRLQEEWEKKIGPDITLYVVESPYRSFVKPFVVFLDSLGTDRPITIAIPQFVTRHWWDNFLHNGSVNQLRKALKRRPYTVVVDVPWLLKASEKSQPPGDRGS